MNDHTTPSCSAGSTPPPASIPPPPAPLNYAFWGDRVIAAVIDGLFVLVVTVVFYAAATALLGALSAVGSGLAGAGAQDAGGGLAALSCSGCCLLFVLFPVVTFLIGLYNKVFLVSKRGSSIGQGVLKLEVVDRNGGRPSKGTLIVRLLAQIGIGLVPFVGSFLDLLWPLWDPQSQTLHDKAVGTFVIKRS